MSRKSNIKLTISVAGGGGPNNIYRDPSYLDWVPNSPSESDSPLPSPKGEVKKFLRVGFMDMDEHSDNSYNQTRRDVEIDINQLSGKGTRSKRFVEPRMSLLGKPLNYRQHRKDARMRKLQAKIYNFLERPKQCLSVVYHILMFAAILTCLILSVLATIEELNEEFITQTVLYIEPIVLVWLIAEFGVRIWAAGCRSRYQGWRGRMRFIRRPLCIVDMVVIVSSVFVLVLGAGNPVFAASTLRGLRFFQILRMVRMDRRGGSWKLLGSVVWAHRQELLTTLYIGLLGLFLFSFLVYLAEKDADKPKFRSYADALWWGVITLCTVGYGDVVPTTWAGKLIAAFSAILGISFFALPAGILGSGFALKVQQQQRQKHLIRRRVPAAQLIQCLWRCYAADTNSMSVATWKPHMTPCPSPTSERPFKTNASFVSRFSTRRRDRSCSSSNSISNNPHSPLLPRKDQNKKPNGADLSEEGTLAINRSHLSLATGIADHKVDHLPIRKETSSPSLSYRDPYEDDFDVSPKMLQLTETHKTAIRSLRKIKYFVARRKFKEALRPYDVKDVIEQYSAGHVDMLGRIKSLQQRLDVILGKVGSKRKDVYDSKQSLASRIVKVERSVEDIESKLDLLIDLYKEDRKPLLQHCQECSIKNNFPAENNQTEVTSCLKNPTEVTSCLKNPTEVTSCLKNPIIPKQSTPRSILLDKHCSEPTSPTTSRTPDKKMQRNLSDLSQRIKKRVTYRLLSLNDQSTHKKSLDPKRQRSVSVDSADILCDTNNIDTNHFEEIQETDQTTQTVLIKDPPPPKKNMSHAHGRKYTNQNDLEKTDPSEEETPLNTTVASEEVKIDFLSINHIVPENVDLQNFPGYKPNV
ncbi:potassium voltage-gated channel subfamily KQT member 1-like isoform X2 [Saccostrea echinata]|uniref:potassium voltage-gated channel subfamily KQT member 1-like isoform X2 n=1 Tax=Saccostrea echinata TaxID=191078 RepID=UPI002A819D0A|nr:potassium voltage-gated channel subfamily KQT member 1-like isoform X2 [Saccostrea echinata]